MHHLNVDGRLIATQAGVTLTVDQVGRAIELLEEAKKRLTDQNWGGLIPLDYNANNLEWFPSEGKTDLTVFKDNTFKGLYGVELWAFSVDWVLYLCSGIRQNTRKGLNNSITKNIDSFCGYDKFCHNISGSIALRRLHMVFGENELAIIILPSWQTSLVKKWLHFWR